MAAYLAARAETVAPASVRIDRAGIAAGPPSKPALPIPPPIDGVRQVLRGRGLGAGEQGQGARAGSGLWLGATPTSGVAARLPASRDAALILTMSIAYQGDGSGTGHGAQSPARRPSPPSPVTWSVPDTPPAPMFRTVRRGDHGGQDRLGRSVNPDDHRQARRGRGRHRARIRALAPSRFRPVSGSRPVPAS